MRRARAQGEGLYFAMPFSFIIYDGAAAPHEESANAAAPNTALLLLAVVMPPASP